MMTLLTRNYFPILPSICFYFDIYIKRYILKLKRLRLVCIRSGVSTPVNTAVSRLLGKCGSVGYHLLADRPQFILHLRRLSLSARLDTEAVDEVVSPDTLQLPRRGTEHRRSRALLLQQDRIVMEKVE